MKQTAVEWLEEQINLTFYVAEASEMNKRFQTIYEQAKAMEKEQKVETWSEAIDYSIMFLKDKTSKTSKKAFDEHYELTYGSNK